MNKDFCSRRDMLDPNMLEGSIGSKEPGVQKKNRKEGRYRLGKTFMVSKDENLEPKSRVSANSIQKWI